MSVIMGVMMAAMFIGFFLGSHHISERYDGTGEDAIKCEERENDRNKDNQSGMHTQPSQQ